MYFQCFFSWASHLWYRRFSRWPKFLYNFLRRHSTHHYTNWAEKRHRRTQWSYCSYTRAKQRWSSSFSKQQCFEWRCNCKWRGNGLWWVGHRSYCGVYLWGKCLNPNLFCLKKEINIVMVHKLTILIHNNIWIFRFANETMIANIFFSSSFFFLFP